MISESLSRADHSIKLAPLCIHLIEDIEIALSDPVFRGVGKSLELHILSRHAEIDVPMMMVLSNFRKHPPWSENGMPEALEWKWEYRGYNIFFKVFDNGTDVIFGGSTHYVSKKDMAWIRGAVARGADAFDVSVIAAEIIKNAAEKTKAVGERSVSMVFPKTGYVDTNLLDRNGSYLVGFIPRMVMANGTMLGPSQFPVEIDIMTGSHLPRHSLFMKQAMLETYLRKRDRRRIIRNRKGLATPGLFGLLSLALFGKVADGYSDFGLGGG